MVSNPKMKNHIEDVEIQVIKKYQRRDTIRSKIASTLHSHTMIFLKSPQPPPQTGRGEGRHFDTLISKHLKHIKIPIEVL